MKELGIVVPIVTPCTRIGELDLDSFRTVCHYVLKAGCHSIFVGGSTGRGPWFSRHDRARVCRAAADFIGSDTPLLAGCMAAGLDDMLENARAMADAGAHIAVVTAPGYFHYSQAEIETILMKFADASPLPVMIYDIPVFAKVKLDWEMVQRLARHDNIIGFKDSTGDFSRFQAPIALMENFPDFQLLQGKERFLVDSLLAGAKGFVVSMVQVDARPYVALYRATQAGEIAQARQLQATASQAMDLFDKVIEQQPATSTLFHFLNWALQHRHICDNILLPHEGDCPKMISDMADQTIKIYEEAVQTVQIGEA
ncbi:MAG: dihydrodipicolinate synthase family protein [Anaerolineae bacterium]|nr:dihydrodipicolinate synthase family protein [Anaerolineae bacterium]